MKISVIISAAILCILLSTTINTKAGERTGKGLGQGDVIVNGYVVYPDFVDIASKAEYKCHGVPSGPYRYLQCSICKKWYVVQPFIEKGITTSIYADAACETGANGQIIKYHDNLPLEPVGICPCVTIQLKK
jgi:hypothetical protein